MREILGHLVMFDAGLRAEDMVLVKNRFPPGRNEPPALFANFAHMSLHRAVCSTIYGLHDIGAVAAITRRPLASRGSGRAGLKKLDRSLSSRESEVARACPPTREPGCRRVAARTVGELRARADLIEGDRERAIRKRVANRKRLERNVSTKG
jgi:hypothetical protein